ncbi:uncharacterized protein LOC133326268 [Musca vetustissima]|uniref:uncharacterized protein LOC133326268 n=1 Tax=Musca vetustissima TaxID=27455 RepID=UPI002AB615DF|nr:uncharacterized protein LOC133326268 [Musca vetustissima]
MSHLLKRTKKSCIKLIRKISNKQIFLKRLEEEDISTDVDISVEAKERDINQNENISMQPQQLQQQKFSTCNKKHKDKAPSSHSSREDITKESHKRKLPLHLDDLNSEKPVLQSLTSKLFLTADGYEFQRLQQLRSDTASEIIPYDPEFNKNEVVFEKVKYKEDVRYLRHTPSTCSLDNYIIHDEDVNEDLALPRDDDDGDEDFINTTNLLQNQNNNNNTICSARNNLNGIDNQIFTSSNHSRCLSDSKREVDTTRGFQLQPLAINACEFQESKKSPTEHQLELQQFSSNQPQLSYQHHHHHHPAQPSNQNLLPLNVSLGCITDGNYHQLFIGEQRDAFFKLTPVVKWDINGNSLEDDDFPVFDANHHLNNSPAKSSLRSSSTTLETWLEVE